MKLTNQIAFRSVDVGFFTAMGALIWRSLVNTYRNPMLIQAKVFQAIFMALFMGGIFFYIGNKNYT